MSGSNPASNDVQISGTVTLIHKALRELRSGGRGIGSSRIRHDRGLQLSVLMPFVERAYVNHLVSRVVGIRESQVVEEIHEHGSLGRIRAGPAGQGRIVGTGLAYGSVVESRSK